MLNNHSIIINYGNSPKHKYGVIITYHNITKTLIFQLTSIGIFSVTITSSSDPEE